MQGNQSERKKDKMSSGKNVSRNTGSGENHTNGLSRERKVTPAVQHK
jgi:hypothetical protein